MIKELIAKVKWIVRKPNVPCLSEEYIAYMSTMPTFEEFESDFIGEVQKLTDVSIPAPIIRDYFLNHEMTPKECAVDFVSKLQDEE